MDTASDRPRREEYADQTRAAVIDAARRLFAENGFFQTKVEQIAKLSRVSPATVYAQCGGKQGLLRLLMDSWTQTPAVVESYQESIAADDAVLVMQTLSAAYLQITRQWGDVIRVVIDGHRRLARRRRRPAGQPDHHLLLRHRRPAPDPRRVRLVAGTFERVAAGSCLRRGPAANGRVAELKLTSSTRPE
jgi:AcrR family transcriptional regulator